MAGEVATQKNFFQIDVERKRKKAKVPKRLVARDFGQSEFAAQRHRQQTLSLLCVFNGFDCDDDGMVTADEFCLALHQRGFEAAAN
ncbi:hypothetical protein ACLOJK_039584 [Asimina triloba]